MSEERPAIVRLEQLYSFPWTEMRAVLARYQRLEELVWVQEEPRNMGAWTYLEPKLRELAAGGRRTWATWAGPSGRARPRDTRRRMRPNRAGSSGRRWERESEGGRHPLPTVAAAGDAKG